MLLLPFWSHILSHETYEVRFVHYLHQIDTFTLIPKSTFMLNEMYIHQVLVCPPIFTLNAK